MNNPSYNPMTQLLHLLRQWSSPGNTPKRKRADDLDTFARHRAAIVLINECFRATYSIEKKGYNMEPTRRALTAATQFFFTYPKGWDDFVSIDRAVLDLLDTIAPQFEAYSVMPPASAADLLNQVYEKVEACTDLESSVKTIALGMLSELRAQFEDATILTAQDVHNVVSSVLLILLNLDNEVDKQGRPRQWVSMFTDLVAQFGIGVTSSIAATALLALPPGS